MNLSRLKNGRNPQVEARSEVDSDSVVDQVRRLGELRDAGLLSAEQFRVRRAQLHRRSI